MNQPKKNAADNPEIVSLMHHCKRKKQPKRMTIASILSYLQAPVLAILLVLYLNKKFQINSNKHLYQAFGLGLITVVSLFLFDLLAETLGYDQLKNLKRSGFYSFVIIGFGSQFGIFIVLRYCFLPLKSFNTPLDGVLYAMLISLGFSTLAVPLFDIGLFARQPSPALIYSLPLACLFFSIIMGFFVGMGKYRKNRLIDSLTGLGAASFFMGFYYFGFLTSEKTILIFYGIGIFFIALLLAIKSTNIKPEKNSRD
ncbi:MAG: PrsW family glutamic-type intramembrane protease [Bacteroidales bacterium]|nr:PrsW family glutamic-type intramembrane protease [Bacteroidales bacterium]